MLEIPKHANGNITTKMEANKIIKARAKRRLSESGCHVPAGPHPGSQQQRRQDTYLLT